MAHFQGFFLEKWILWKSSILKRFIFVVPKYSNLTSVKTHRDRLENSGESILEQRVQIFGFGKGRRPHRGFECCPIVALSFFYLLCPQVFENFLAFALDRPFGFSPQSLVLSFHFHFFIIFFYCPIMHLIIQNSSQTGGWFIKNFGWGIETTALLIMKIFSRKKTLQSKYPRSIKMDFLGT